MWYVINTSTGCVVATCSGKPDEQDLRSRGELAVEAEEIPLEVAEAARAGDRWVVRRNLKPPSPSTAVFPPSKKLDALIEWAKSLGFQLP
ncbi:MAG: hypothetical protein HPY52_11030 [Firmicutes bacterium]|nr:hypothetical protein [Bacillota bacterium]